MDSFEGKLLIIYVFVFMVCFPIGGIYWIAKDPGYEIYKVNGSTIYRKDNDGNEIPKSSTVGWGYCIINIRCFILGWSTHKSHLIPLNN
jgi:hypothetical protein